MFSVHTHSELRLRQEHTAAHLTQTHTRALTHRPGGRSVFIPSSRICVARTDLRTMWTVIGKIMLLHLLLMETQCVKGKRQYGFFFFLHCIAISLSVSVSHTQSGSAGSDRICPCVVCDYTVQPTVHVTHT